MSGAITVLYIVYVYLYYANLQYCLLRNFPSEVSEDTFRQQGHIDLYNKVKQVDCTDKTIKIPSKCILVHVMFSYKITNYINLAWTYFKMMLMVSIIWYYLV